MISAVVLAAVLLTTLRTGDEPDCDQIMADVVATLERGSLDLPQVPPACQQELKRDLDSLTRDQS